MQIVINFDIAYKILFKQCSLFEKTRGSDGSRKEFKKQVIKDEASLSIILGLNSAEISESNYDEHGYQRCKMLASYVCKMRNELPFNCNRVANMFVKEVLGIGDPNAD